MREGRGSIRTPARSGSARLRRASLAATSLNGRTTASFSTDGGVPAFSATGRGSGSPQVSGVGSRLTSTRSEEHTSELQSLMRISYAVFCLKKNKTTQQYTSTKHLTHPIYI